MDRQNVGRSMSGLTPSEFRSSGATSNPAMGFPPQLGTDTPDAPPTAHVLQGEPAQARGCWRSSEQMFASPEPAGLSDQVSRCVQISNGLKRLWGASEDGL